MMGKLFDEAIKQANLKDDDIEKIKSEISKEFFKSTEDDAESLSLSGIGNFIADSIGGAGRKIANIGGYIFGGVSDDPIRFTDAQMERDARIKGDISIASKNYIPYELLPKQLKQYIDGKTSMFGWGDDDKGNRYLALVRHQERAFNTAPDKLDDKQKDFILDKIDKDGFFNNDKVGESEIKDARDKWLVERLPLRDITEKINKLNAIHKDKSWFGLVSDDNTFEDYKKSVADVVTQFGFDGVSINKDEGIYVKRDKQIYKIEPTFWQDILDSAVANVGSGIGAGVGYAIGRKIAPIVGLVESLPSGGSLISKGALKSIIKKYGTVSGGSILGAAVGGAVDALVINSELNRDVTAGEILNHALESGALTAVGEVVGSGVIKPIVKGVGKTAAFLTGVAPDIADRVLRSNPQALQNQIVKNKVTEDELLNVLNRKELFEPNEVIKGKAISKNLVKYANDAIDDVTVTKGLKDKQDIYTEIVLRDSDLLNKHLGTLDDADLKVARSQRDKLSENMQDLINDTWDGGFNSAKEFNDAIDAFDALNREAYKSNMEKISARLEGKTFNFEQDLEDLWNDIYRVENKDKKKALSLISKLRIVKSPDGVELFDAERDFNRTLNLRQSINENIANLSNRYNTLKDPGDKLALDAMVKAKDIVDKQLRDALFEVKGDDSLVKAFDDTLASYAEGKEKLEADIAQKYDEKQLKKSKDFIEKQFKVNYADLDVDWRDTIFASLPEEYRKKALNTYVKTQLQSLEDKVLSPDQLNILNANLKDALKGVNDFNADYIDVITDSYKIIHGLDKLLGKAPSKDKVSASSGIGSDLTQRVKVNLATNVFKELFRRVPIMGEHAGENFHFIEGLQRLATGGDIKRALGDGTYSRLKDRSLDDALKISEAGETFARAIRGELGANWTQEQFLKFFKDNPKKAESLIDGLLKRLGFNEIAQITEDKLVE